MKTINVIYATGALKKFLDARARGVSKEILMQLSADALEEQRSVAGQAADLTGGVVVEFDRARRERKQRGLSPPA